MGRQRPRGEGVLARVLDGDVSELRARRGAEHARRRCRGRVAVRVPMSDPERVARFADESSLVPDSTPRVPIVAADVLCDLGLGEATVEEQRAGVARWLTENEPSP